MRRAITIEEVKAALVRQRRSLNIKLLKVAIDCYLFDETDFETSEGLSDVELKKISQTGSYAKTDAAITQNGNYAEVTSTAATGGGGGGDSRDSQIRSESSLKDHFMLDYSELEMKEKLGEGSFGVGVYDVLH